MRTSEAATNERIFAGLLFVAAMTVAVFFFIGHSRGLSLERDRTEILSEVCSITEDPAQCIVELRNG